MSEMTAKNIRIIFSGDFLDGAEVCYPIVGFDLAKPGGDMHSENEQIVSPFERAIREYTRACLGLSNDWRTFKCALTKKPKSNDIFAEANLTRIGDKNNQAKPYPHWVCNDCGTKAALASKTHMLLISCVHEGDCEVCGNTACVTEARDFGYPDFEGHIRYGSYAEWNGKHPFPWPPYIDIPLFQADKLESIDKRRVYLGKAAIIGSTQYSGKFHALKIELEQHGYMVKMPAFDSDKDKDELQVCEYNREIIEWADVVYIIWDARSVGTIFDFGMCFAMRKPVVIQYIEPKTFAGVMEKYAAKCGKGVTW